jgi:hypothetical protein
MFLAREFLKVLSLLQEGHFVFFELREVIK